MLSLEKNIPNQEVQIRPIKQIITTIIIATQPPASSKEISAFVPAIIPFTIDTVALNAVLIPL